MSNRRYSIGIVMATLVILVSVWCPIAFGQQTTGSVTGTVTDTSNAIIAAATVKLTNAVTGVNLAAQSDTAGTFRFLQLPPGTYLLETRAPGFKTVRRDGIVVEADRSQAIPVELTIGEVNETVEVEAGALLLEANTSELGTVMDRGKIEDLPLNTRNPMGLANLIPTVRGLSVFGGPVTKTYRAGSVNIGGGPPISNGFLIDGVANDKILDAAGAMTFLTADAVEEFKVLTSVFSSEYGRTGGGVISVISRSGTNEYHGTAYEFLRNTLLKANDFFSNSAGAARPIEHINQYGGTFGGPVKRDKLFFFFNYEGYKERRTPSRLNTTPTALQRIGDFSQTHAANGSLIIIYDPTTTVPNPNGSGYIRTPFPDNVIPLKRQNPLAQSILGMFPLPNTRGNAVTGINNLLQTGSQPVNRYDAGLKMDYNVSQNRRLAVRFTRDDVSWTYANYYNSVLENEGRYTAVPRDSASLQYTDTLSPSLLLDAKLGYNHDFEYAWGAYSQKYGVGVDPVALGLPANVVALQQKGRYTPRGAFPRFNVSDLVTCGGCNNAIGSQGDDYRGGADTAASAAITKIRRAHTVKTGFQTVMYVGNTGGVGQPTFYFDRGFTQGPDPTKASSTAGYGQASFMLGTPSATQSSILPYQAENAFGQHFYAVFVQDDWKVTRKLTLNLGVRWEYEQPQTDRFNVLTNINLSDPSPLASNPALANLSLRGFAYYPASTGGSRGSWDSTYRHFGPRLGYAYQVTSKLVARGGYGITFIPFKGYALPTFTGFRTTNPMITSINGGLTPFNTMSNPYPNGIQLPTNASLGALTGIGSDFQGYVRSITPGYVQQWNFTLQYQPRNNWLIETAYLGARGIRLLTSQNINYNQIDPQYLSLGSQLLQSVPNPFYGIIASGPLSNPTITRQQLLLPHPQYTSVTGDNGFLGNSIYHGFTLKVEKRFSRGFSILAAYTLSKLIDGAVGSGGSTRGAAFGLTASDPNSPILNWYNLAAERSKGIEDVPQRMILTVLWELPIGKETQGWQHQVLAGWHLNTITTLQSGLTIAPISTATNRPNVVPGQNPSLPVSTLTKWFNTGAYSAALPFTYGNASRTIPNVQGPGVRNIDFSFFKDFAIKERYKLQFRGEAFNLFNTPAFDVPGRDVTSQTFGVVTAISGSPASRELQFSLRLTF